MKQRGHAGARPDVGHRWAAQATMEVGTPPVADSADRRGEGHGPGPGLTEFPPSTAVASS
jgi:hypothetical protein